MITFLICLALLVAAYFTYGTYLERVCGIDEKNPVPSATHFDGVDYVPMPRWRTFLIQLLNIAGLGPIFGAILGAAYGPVAFLWITLGGIFFGAMHDFVAGVISVKQDGLSLPEIIGRYLGRGAKLFMRLFTVGLMILVGAVFMSQPAELIAAKIDCPTLDNHIVVNGFSAMLLIVIGVILIYYVIATLLPVDKLIGRIYPIFGFALFFMAGGILVALLFGDYTIPELTSLRNQIAGAENFPIMPTLFTTIACGAISGFHATQSPLMARCIRNEKECKSVFFGAMIAESIIALIWAAIAMAFWGNVEGLNEALGASANKAAILVDEIANATMGRWLAYLVIFGVIAAAITSGDTAFRSARLIVADFMGIEQKSLAKRVAVSLPIFALGVIIILFLDFRTMWSYFAWMNQSLAVFTLWAITVYLFRRGKWFYLAMIPALVMTYVCVSYIFVSPIMAGMENRTLAYLCAGGVTLVVLIYFVVLFRKSVIHGKSAA